MPKDHTEFRKKLAMAAKSMDESARAAKDATSHLAKLQADAKKLKSEVVKDADYDA